MKRKSRKNPKPAKKKSATPPTFDAKLLRYTISEAASLLRLSRSKVYLDIEAGDIQTITHGRRRFVPGTEIARLCSLPAPDASRGAA